MGDPLYRTSSSSIGTHPQPFPQHSRKKDGLIHLHLKIMERYFITRVLWKGAPLTLVKESIYLSRGGWFSSDIHLSGCFLRVAQALGGMRANL